MPTTRNSNLKRAIAATTELNGSLASLIRELDPDMEGRGQAERILREFSEDALFIQRQIREIFGTERLEEDYSDLNGD